MTVRSPIFELSKYHNLKSNTGVEKNLLAHESTKLAVDQKLVETALDVTVQGVEPPKKLLNRRVSKHYVNE